MELFDVGAVPPCRSWSVNTEHVGRSGRKRKISTGGNSLREGCKRRGLCHRKHFRKGRSLELEAGQMSFRKLLGWGNGGLYWDIRELGRAIASQCSFDTVQV